MSDIVKTIDFSAQLKNIVSVFQGTSEHERHDIVMSTPPLSIEERAYQRVLNEDILRQKNIEDVVQGAAEMLTHGELGTQTKFVDEDWLRQFKNCLQDISEKDMKLIWSKVLAGEIKKPKSYSIRTIHLLGKLSKDDADIITKIAPFTLTDSSGRRVIIHERRKDNGLLEFSDLLFLSELGLLETSLNVGMSWTFDNIKDDYSNCITLNNGSVGINIYTNQKEYALPAYTATVVGNQIFSLIEGVDPNTDYYQSVLKDFVKGSRCTCGHISGLDNNGAYILSDTIFEIV